ncbi:MAG: hypothetical protein ACREDZ_12615 [Kiloniellales bacterium]
MSYRPHPEALRDFFLGWQCRIRQIAARQQGGRPSQAMQPRVTTARGEPSIEAMTLLLVLLEPEESTAFFRFQVQKTPDPRQVYEQALAYLAGDYYQQPEAFSDEMTALFGQEDARARSLIAAGRCRLAFEQYAQAIEMICRVRALKSDAASYQATLWHNRLFNPSIPDGVTILAFRPDWRTARAEPPPPG